MSRSKNNNILVFGGTGLIGRPVVRQMVSHGHHVRIYTRKPVRAEALLPEQCEIIKGDLTDRDALLDAMTDIDAIYTSLPNRMTMTRPAWDPDVEGVKNIIAVAKEAGVQRLLKLSAMGVGEDRANWWVADAKAQIEDVIRESGLQYTIFRPTWFMESLPLFGLGPHMFVLPAPKKPLYWLAGEDYGKQVCAALRSREAINQTYLCQGADPLSMKDACTTFAEQVGKRFVLTPIPQPAVWLGAKVAPPMHYLKHLLDMTYNHVVNIPKDVNGMDLYRPRITVEQFAADLSQTTDWPNKSLAIG